MTRDTIEAGARESVRSVIPDPKIRPTLDIAEAAVIMDVSRATAYAAARSGQLPTVRMGARWLVPTAKLLDMLGLAG